jgi:tetraacyldisaccharide 4'-kinase
LNQEYYHKLLSGKNGGRAAALLRLFLTVISWFYSAVVVLRNALYSKGWLKVHRVSAVVISVGNITAGGTGKTPLVIWLYNQIIQNAKLKTKNYTCAILTRGYKAAQNPKLKTQNYIDEPAILINRCPEANVIVNPDRVAGAADAVSEFGADLLILDDGFQHRRLNRNVDIVTIDATCPFGYGKLLPAGLLREPVAALRRADAVVLTRCDRISEFELDRIEKELQLINRDMIIARSTHNPVRAGCAGDKEISLDELRNKKIFALCGIGNPDAFLNTARDLGGSLVGSKVYDDHHHYTNDCLAGVYEEAGHLGADLILTTEKDWTKLIVDCRSSIADCRDVQCAYLAVELEFLAGEDKLKILIEDALTGRIPQK